MQRKFSIFNFCAFIINNGKEKKKIKSESKVNHKSPASFINFILFYFASSLHGVLLLFSRCCFFSVCPALFLYPLLAPLEQIPYFWWQLWTAVGLSSWRFVLTKSSLWEKLIMSSTFITSPNRCPIKSVILSKPFLLSFRFDIFTRFSFRMKSYENK